MQGNEIMRDNLMNTLTTWLLEIPDLSPGGKLLMQATFMDPAAVPGGVYAYNVALCSSSLS